MKLELDDDVPVTTLVQALAQAGLTVVQDGRGGLRVRMTASVTPLSARRIAVIDSQIRAGIRRLFGKNKGPGAA